jgi:hypothetical protein
MKIDKNFESESNQEELEFFFIKLNFYLDENKTSLYGTYSKNSLIENEEYFYSIFQDDSEKLKDLAEEIYEIINNYVESQNLYMESYMLMAELNGCYSKEDKISLLKSNLKNLWKQDEHSGIFLMFMGKKENLNDQDWKDNTIELFVQIPNLLTCYLKGELMEYYTSKLIENDGVDELIIEWLYFSKIRNLIKFCEDQILLIENISSDKINSSLLDTSQMILLLEKIISDNNWSDYSATKKGQIVSILIDKNADNIKKKYLELDKKTNDQNRKKVEKINKDILKVDNLYKDILG